MTEKIRVGIRGIGDAGSMRSSGPGSFPAMFEIVVRGVRGVSRRRPWKWSGSSIR